MIQKRGKNEEGSWLEQWYQKDNEKWASKEGINNLTKDLWHEEWIEKIDSVTGKVEKKCEKWAKNEERNEEWKE